MFLRYLGALALTLAVEVPLYTLALRYAWGLPTGRAVRLAAGVNLATHPVLWWSLALWPPGSAYPLVVALAETAKT